MVGTDAAHTGHCAVPPLLTKKKALVSQIERPTLPFRCFEPLVLRQGIDARLSALSAFGKLPREMAVEPHALADALVDELQLLARRDRQMESPIRIGFAQRDGREPECPSGEPSVCYAV